MKVPQVRNMYRKVGFARTAAPQKSGFGYTHDGAIDTLPTFFAQPVFNPWPSGTKDDIVTFLMSVDTGTAPAVGYQFELTQANAGSPGYAADLALITARAAAGDLELTAHGLLDGRVAGLLYVPASGHFTVDRSGEGPFTPAQLQGKAVAGNANLAFTAVMPGTGNRIALDRDLDGTRNGDEDADAYGLATAGCAGLPRLLANSEPRQGNALFGLVDDTAPPNSIGIRALTLGAASFPVLGVTFLLDPTVLVLLVTVSDAQGGSTFGWPVTPAETPGLSIFSQTLWLDACGSEGWSSSQGLSFTFRP